MPLTSKYSEFHKVCEIPEVATATTATPDATTITMADAGETTAHHPRIGTPWCTCGKQRKACVRTLVWSLFGSHAAGLAHQAGGQECGG